MNLEQVKEKIETITYRKDLLNVFKIIYENETYDKYIINENGVFIKLNILHDSTAELIYNYLQSIEQEILKIDEIVNDRLENVDVLNNVSWSIDKFWLDNFKSYEFIDIYWRLMR